MGCQRKKKIASSSEIKLLWRSIRRIDEGDDDLITFSHQVQKIEVMPVKSSEEQNETAYSKPDRNQCYENNQGIVEVLTVGIIHDVQHPQKVENTPVLMSPGGQGACVWINIKARRKTVSEVNPPQRQAPGLNFHRGGLL